MCDGNNGGFDSLSFWIYERKSVLQKSNEEGRECNSYTRVSVAWVPVA